MYLNVTTLTKNACALMTRLRMSQGAANTSIKDVMVHSAATTQMYGWIFS